MSEAGSEPYAGNTIIYASDALSSRGPTRAFVVPWAVNLTIPEGAEVRFFFGAADGVVTGISVRYSTIDPDGTVCRHEDDYTPPGAGHTIIEQTFGGSNV